MTATASARARRLLDAAHSEPRVQAGAAAGGVRERHVLHDGRRQAGARRARYPVVRERRALPAEDRGRDTESGGDARLRVVVLARPPAPRSRPRGVLVALAPDGFGHMFFHELGVGGREDRAQDRAGLSSPDEAHRPARGSSAASADSTARTSAASRWAACRRTARPSRQACCPAWIICATRRISGRARSCAARPRSGAELADELEDRIIPLHDASNIAAVIVEPVAGAGGVLIPPRGYLAAPEQSATSTASSSSSTR